MKKKLKMAQYITTQINCVNLKKNYFKVDDQCHLLLGLLGKKSTIKSSQKSCCSPGIMASHSNAWSSIHSSTYSPSIKRDNIANVLQPNRFLSA